MPSLLLDRRHGNSIFFIDSIISIICNPTGASRLFTPTLYVCEIISSSQISLDVQLVHQWHSVPSDVSVPTSAVPYCKPIMQYRTLPHTYLATMAANRAFHSHPIQTKCSPRLGNVISRSLESRVQKSLGDKLKAQIG